MTTEIRHVTVVGAGTMGAEIAALAALGGYETHLNDASPEALERAKAKLETRLPAMERKGQLPAGAAAAGLTRLRFTPELQTALVEADFVIEAVYEDLDVKRRIFSDLDRLAPAHAVLASNSSMIASSRFADVTGRPAQVINMHFFTPPLLSKVVEVVQGPHAADSTAEATMEVVRRMNLEPVLLTQECFGFVVNRVLMAILNESLQIVEEGVATPEQVDNLVAKALGHSIGPFRILDLVGNDVAQLINRETERYSGRPVNPKLLAEKVARGELGRKTGKGWYTY